VNFAVHFIRTRSSLILTCSSGSFLFYILLVGVVEGKKRIVGRVGEGKEMDIEDRPIFSISKS